jgi:hypothetical protein
VGDLHLQQLVLEPPRREVNLGSSSMAQG